MSKADTHNEERRSFLRNSTLLGAGAALAAGAPAVASQSDNEAVSETPEKKTRQGYRVTPHIANYYRNAAS